MITPRPYQLAQVAGVLAAHAQGHRSVLIEAGTGTGKTNTMAMLAKRAVETGERVLFLAHRAELVDQAAARFTTFGLVSSIERGPQVADRSAQVICASVQTLRGARLASWPADWFDLVLVDESHHAVATMYRNILERFTKARVVGVTATTDRADGVPLAEVFDTVAHRYDIAQAVQDGFLCPVEAILVEVAGLDLSKVRLRRTANQEGVDETVDLLAGRMKGPAQARYAPGGVRYSADLHPGDLGKAVCDAAAVEGVVAPLLELAGSRRTVVFAVDRKHAARLAQAINVRRHGAARVVHGAMTKTERASVLADHRAGRYQFLINVMLLTEGYDDPAIDCVALVRPTQSRVLYCQAVGRALRIYANKKTALLLDFTGVGCRLDLVGPEDCLEGALVGPVRVRKSGVARKGPPPIPCVDLTAFAELEDDTPSSTSASLADIPWSVTSFRAIRGASVG